MDSIYAWILMILLRPAAAEVLPYDTIRLVDPWDPMESSLFIDAVFAGRIPAGVVTDLCLVESGGCRRPIGIHAGDSNVAPRVHRRAEERGFFPAWCPFYWDLDPLQVSTRGNHGQIYAYSAHYLGRCLPLDVLDVPLFSALRAGMRAEEVCRNKYNRQTRQIRAGEREGGARTRCTSEDIRVSWAGGHKARERVIAKWHDRVGFWRPRVRRKTDWRGRCVNHTGLCESSLKNRPTLAQFRARAAGEKAKW